MKKLICFISTAAALAGFLAPAATINEWNFYSDQAGKTLPNTVNSAGSAFFIAVPGYNDSYLRTDGLGALLSTFNDPGTAGMWTNGALLDATTASLTTGVFFLRYDIEYDLNSTNNNSGTLLGFSFTDAAGTKVAGVALQCDLGVSAAPINLNLNSLCDLTNFTGKVNVIAKVDMTAQKMAVWYDLNGTGSFTAESSPQTNNISINLPAINKLHFQATGDFRPAGDNDFVKVGLLRMSDSFADATAAAGPDAPAAKYSNEWNFDRDVNGRQLSDTINTGTNSPLAQFRAGSGSTVFTSNKMLRCTGEDTGTGGVWTNGAILNAALSPAGTGVHYLRYDVRYSLTNSLNNSGTLLGVYFTGDAGDQAAGLVLGYDTGDLLGGAMPANRTLTAVTNGLPLSGTLSAVAEVNMDTHTLRVWYDLSGSNTFDTNAPAASTAISLTSITNLRFHATGDFRPSGSTDYADVDNIRHTASLSEAIAPPMDLTSPAALQIIAVNYQRGMEKDQTNKVEIVIRNNGGRPATNVTSTLSHSGALSDFSVIPSNAPALLEAGAALTNTYWLIANSSTSGQYIFTAQAVCIGTSSVATNFTIVVGSQISYLTNSITEVPGTGIFANLYEPGEVLTVSIVNTNDGALDVFNVTNTLSANPAYFRITPAGATYGWFELGTTATTDYTVEILDAAPAGLHTFSVANRTSNMVWNANFQLSVYKAARPSVSTNLLTILVPAGGTATGAVLLTNAGNDSTTFSLTDNGLWPVAYLVTTQQVSLTNFSPNFESGVDTNTTFVNWNGNSSASMSVGFDFPLFGTVYTNFSVSRYGTIGFGGNSLVAPFQTGTVADTNSIRYKKTASQLVVAWGNNTGNEFQAWLSANGNIRYVYQPVSRTNAADVLVQSGAGSLTIANYNPETGERSDVLLTPVSRPWVTNAPVAGTLAGQTDQTVTFYADAAGRTAGTTNIFTNNIAWGTGSNSPVVVRVIVTKMVVGLRASPTPVAFIGPAGFITRTNVSLINTGNVSLAYTISDFGAQSSGYNWAATNFQWKFVPDSDANAIVWTGGRSQTIPLGFPFRFYGNSYTQLSIGVNGWVALGADQVIAPYQGDLVLDDNANIRYSGDSSQFTVTWENVGQSGGGADLTFQATLNRSGSIRFQYRSLTGSAVWPSTPIGLQDSVWTESATLSNRQTTVITTNYSTTQIPHPWEPDQTITVTNGTNIVVSFADVVTDQAISFVPAGPTVITASPLNGTIPVSGTNVVTLTGDARSLTSGGATNVFATTVFRIGYIGGAADLPVSFNATNSVEPGYPAVEMMFGSDGVVSVAQNTSGARIISWQAAGDPLDRIYKVWYTLDLLQGFRSPWLAEITNGTSYVDTIHTNVPVIYYKVTVE